MNRLKIGSWNANGLQATTINDILQQCHSLQMLFITETWLLVPTSLPTTCKQYHQYGTAVAGNYRGQMGITALVHPSFPYQILQTPTMNNHSLAFKLGNLQIICLYLLRPWMMTAIRILKTIPMEGPTLICGDLNARIGTLVGDTRVNVRGTEMKEWLEDHDLIVHNGHLARGIPTYLTYRNNTIASSIIDLFISNFALTNSEMPVPRRPLSWLGPPTPVTVVRPRPTRPTARPTPT